MDALMLISLGAIVFALFVLLKEKIEEKQLDKQFNCFTPEILSQNIPLNVISHFKKEVLLKQLIQQDVLDSQLDNIKLSLAHYLYHSCRSKKSMIMPSRLVDELWHSFLLHNDKYELFCITYLGKKVAHIPNEKADNKLFNLTKEKQFSNTAIYTFLKIGVFAETLFLMDNFLIQPEETGWIYTKEDIFSLSTTPYKNSSSNNSSCSGAAFDFSRGDSSSCGSSCGGGCG